MLTFRADIGGYAVGGRIIIHEARELSSGSLGGNVKLTGFGPRLFAYTTLRWLDL